MDLKLAIPKEALYALSVFDEANEEGWLVGGCVRDAVLLRPVHDIDIACSTLWTDTKALFSDHQTHETGVKHGTITVVIDGTALEITTFRTDGKYTDNRHPDSVRFVRTLEEDLARRDFTVNAMAYHPQRGFVDPFDGVSDCRARIIRCVRDPRERFKEDALRILRAVRFMAQLGFEIEPATFSAMIEHKDLLKSISVERLREELTKIICAPHARQAIIQCIDVIGVVIPELVLQKGFDQCTPYHCFDILEHSACAVEHAPSTPLLRWATLLHDIGKPSAFFKDESGQGHFFGHAKLGVPIARDILTRLRFGVDFTERVCALVLHHDDVVPATAKSIKRALRKFDGDIEMFRCFCAIQAADSEAHAPEYRDRTAHAAELERILDQILNEKAPLCVKDLTINGRDLMALGIPQGPRIGEILNQLLDAVIDQKIPNERDALLGAVLE